MAERKPRQKREVKPATTPEAREQQLIHAAINLAEQQLIDGTASAAVITHYLKLGSTREVEEREMLRKQVKLLEAKVESIHQARDAEDSSKAALEALRSYNSGSK